MGLFKEKATVKSFFPAKGKKRMFAFVTLNEKDGRDVYVGQDVLESAGITELSVGQAVKIKHGPSDKRPGTLQATVISA
jgi:cold shock CspA family protein